MLNYPLRIILIFFIFACAEATLDHSVFAQQRPDGPEPPPLVSKLTPEGIHGLIHEKPIAAAIFGLVSLTVLCAVLAGIALNFWYLINKAIGRELLPQSPVGNVSWRISDGVVVLVYYIAVPMSIGLIWRTLHGGDVQGRSVQLLGLLISAIINAAIILLVFWIVKSLRGGALSELGFKKGNCRKSLKIGVIGYLMTLPILIGAALSSQYVLYLLGKRPSVQELVEFMRRESSPMVLTLIMIYGVLLGPILEEILFRGFLQAALRQRLGSKMAIGVTALLFALMHLNISVLAPIFILGIALGFLYERTQSLIVPIALHVLNNSVMMTLLIAEKALHSEFL